MTRKHEPEAALRLGCCQAASLIPSYGVSLRKNEAVIITVTPEVGLRLPSFKTHNFLCFPLVTVAP